MTDGRINTDREVIGLVVTGTAMVLLAVTIIARVWRDQPVSEWPLIALGVIGALVYIGQRLGRLRATREGLDVDVDGEDAP